MKSPGEIVKNNLRLGLFLKLKTMSYNNTIEWNQAQADSIRILFNKIDSTLS